MIDAFYSPAIKIPALALLLGAVLGVIYDAFRLLRMMSRRGYDISDKYRAFISGGIKSPGMLRGKLAVLSGNTLIFVEDIVFWLTVAFSEIIFMYYFCSGQLRIFVMLFSLLGFTAYYNSIGRVVRYLGSYIIFTVKWVIYRFAVRPALFVLKKIYSVLEKLYKATLYKLFSAIYVKIMLIRTQRLYKKAYAYIIGGGNEDAYEKKGNTKEKRQNNASV